MTTKIICLLLLSAYPCHAADICFTADTVGKFAVELEQCRVIKEDLELCNESIANLNQTVSVQEKELDIHKSAAEEARKATEEYKKLFDKQRELFNAALKESNPGFFERLTKNATLVGTGAAIGAIATIFLLRR